jgi:hypothetical protein
MGGSQTVTAAQAVTDAQSVNLLVGQTGTFSQYTASMRAANPSLKLVVYLNGVYAGGAKVSTYPESWFMHDANGSRITSSQFPRDYLMDPTNSSWIQTVENNCSSALAATGWDGCYLDMLGPGTLTPGYLSSTPIDVTTGAPWTNTDWVTATTNLASTVAAALPGVYLIGNGLGNGTQYFTQSWGPSSMLFGPLVAADAQGFVRGDSDPPTQFRSESQWKADVDMLVDAAGRGRSVMVESKVWNSTATQDQMNAIHRYALATFLLGTDGNQYWYWSDTGSESAVIENTPYENVNVGTPVAPYAKMLGAYQRRYSGGVVVVNPTSSSVTIPLGAGQWTTLDGTTVSGSFTLAANSGDVLTAPGPWGPVPAVTNEAVSKITSTTATVSSTVNGNGLTTTASAEYGTDSTLGTLVPGASVTAIGSTTRPIPLTGLKPGTTYTVHVDATNSAGTVAGTDITFTTLLSPPLARTGPATVNSSSQVTVTGYANPKGQATTYYVQYGASTSYGGSSSPQSAGSGTTQVTETTVLTGLPTGVLHYRSVAVNTGGTTYGADRTVKLK